MIELKGDGITERRPKLLFLSSPYSFIHAWQHAQHCRSVATCGITPAVRTNTLFIKKKKKL